jgi:hypothetical protein
VLLPPPKLWVSARGDFYEALQAWLAAFMPPPDPAAQQSIIEQALAELLRRS